MPKLSGPPAPPAGFTRVHSDAQLLVVDKPPGLLCVPGRGPAKQDCLSARVQQAYPGALVVHRLDMATSGLCLFAIGPDMQRRMQRAFADREVGKRYVAHVAGQLPQGEEWQVIDLPIGADWPRRPLRVVDPLDGKPSQTRWRAISYDGATGSTRVELEPLTGRTHQLRVHLQAIGHPILGDALYAPPEIRDAAPRLLLHACELSFIHPMSSEPVRYGSAVPF